MARIGSALVLYDPRTADPEATAVVGFLGGHKGRTREAYELDLRQFARWCQHRGMRLFDVTRVDIERFARDLEQSGRAPATISRRLATVTGLYRFAEEEGLIDHSPAVHVRRPRVDPESHAVGLDRNELGAFLVTPGISSSLDHALASLPALNGLRVSEALGADVAVLGFQRGHRTLFVSRKGNKTATVPLAPPVPLTWPSETATPDPSSATPTAGVSTVTPPPASCGASAAKPGSRNGSDPTLCAHAFITAALDAGVPRRDVQEAASHTPTPAPPCATTAGDNPSTATPPTSSPPSSPAPPEPDPNERLRSPPEVLWGVSSGPGWAWSPRRHLCRPGPGRVGAGGCRSTRRLLGGRRHRSP